MKLRLSVFLFIVVFACSASNDTDHAGEPVPAKPIRILFLGDDGHHKPAERFRQLQTVLDRRGIELVYTDKVESLDARILGKYDGLVLYANIEKIAPEQEQALLEFVAAGKGFIPIHCASYCFLNSPKYIELVGAQFKKHGTGIFRTVGSGEKHPIVKGFQEFESWDETYVHAKHNEKDRIVLAYREDDGGKEPWTWIRTHGKGRVFYTAWGHDERTWGHPGFQNLIERGIRWAVGADPGAVPDFVDRPEMTKIAKNLKPFEYVEADVPYYPGGKPWGTLDKKKMMMQLPLSPQESVKHMVTPVGFEVKLFASEPQIKRPICMNWDERGRLWIAETVDYPNNRQKEGEGNDRIVICEDTDGDGVADKFTVFADKLSIPTGFTFAHGGIVVVQAPHTLFLRSSKGDDKCDERKVLFTGWGTGDTHAGPSNLQYGLDNWIYGIVGYSGFDGTVNGEKHKFGQGFFRFKLTVGQVSQPAKGQVSQPAKGQVSQPAKGQVSQPAKADGERQVRKPAPRVEKLEFLRSTNNNTWGLGFSEEGHLFGSTANGNPSVHMPIANRFYEAVRGWSTTVAPSMAGNAKMHPITDKVRQVDYHGHFTAAAGHALYTARLYPKEYWNKTAFVCEPTGHLVACFQITPDGSGFTSRNAWNLLASDDEWCAPIMAEVGPDGCVWVIDWYNYIVQHNPTPAGFKTGKGNAYETELRDKKHGRIYRIVPKGAKTPAPLDLKKATPKELVATLKNDNMFWRKQGQRLLVEGNHLATAQELVALTRQKAPNPKDIEPAGIHALWTLNGFGAWAKHDDKLVTELASALQHPSVGVRRNAVLSIPRNEESFQDRNVRLELLLTLAEVPRTRDDFDQIETHAVTTIIELLLFADTDRDRLLADAFVGAAAHYDSTFLGFALFPLSQEKGKFPEQALRVITIVAEHYARNPKKDIRVIEALAKWHDKRVSEAVLTGLAKGWPMGTQLKLSEKNESGLIELFPMLSPAGRSNLLKLANLWGSKVFEKHAAEIAKSFLAVVADEKAKDDDRITAARQLVEMKAGDAAVIEALLAQVTPRTSPKVAAGLIDALATSTSPAIGPALVKNLNSLTPAARTAALRILLSRPESTRAFLDAVDKGQAQLGDLSLDQKQALAASADAKIAARAKGLLAKGGGLPSADRQKVIDHFLPLIKKSGEVAVGKAMFKKHCAVCHTHGGEGAKVGPDLTGMAAHPKSELLIQILDPSRSVEGNYRLYHVTLADGRSLNGILAAESKTAIELIDAEAKKHVLQRDNIEQLVASNKSLMPDGFEKLLSDEELVGLMEFLTQRGQFLPLNLAKAATVVSTRGMFFGKESEIERLILPDWSPRTVKGVPFHFVDPNDQRDANVILLYGPEGTTAPKMPKSVKLPCNGSAKAIHFLSGVAGWAHPLGQKGSVSMIVRLHYADGKTEDHPLKNGEHFADYIRRVDVPGSEFAFMMRGQQMRYLAIHPRRDEAIAEIELVKGDDRTAPVVLAVTVERREK